MNIEALLKQWKTDSVIHEHDLDNASLQSAILHSKYLEMLSQQRMRLKQLELQFKILLKDKWLWYNGKLSKDEIDEKGWSYDPLKGLKILKGDLNYFYDSDPDIQKHQAKIEYSKEVIAVLEEIMHNIRWRHSTIKNAIEWRKFTSGM